MDPCERIRAKIRQLVFQTKEECGIRGLRERIMDQIYGANGPGTPERDGHDIAITQLKNQIRKLMEDFSKKLLRRRVSDRCGRQAVVESAQPETRGMEGLPTGILESIDP